MPSKNRIAEVKLKGRQTPFVAREVEVLASGWVRAVGYFPKHEADPEGLVVVIERGAGEYHWPPHRVREVRHD